MKRRGVRTGGTVKTASGKPRCVAVSPVEQSGAQRRATAPAFTAVPVPSGIRLATLVALPESGIVMIMLQDGPEDVRIVPARATVLLQEEDIGRQAAVMFEKGDSDSPILIGLIETFGGREAGLPANGPEAAAAESVLEIDVHRLVFNAAREVVLRCGEASIILTKSGKVLIRGAQVLSRATGVNRIKGGSVQIN